MTALIDVDQLRTFIAIVETGSFTKAAEVVHKTQSAVSMQMKRLEERLDRSVFARDGRASKLTEDGERLLDYARRIVKLNIEALSAFDHAGLTGRVRLGLPDDYADRYLPEIMARFSRAYPGVELTVLCEPSVELFERIDGNRAFVGGINFSADHLADFGAMAKQDYSVFISGPVAADIRQACLELLDQHGAGSRTALVGCPLPHGSSRVRLALRDNTEHRTEIEAHYLLAIRAARERLVIANADTTGHSDGIQSYLDRNITIRGNWIEQASSAMVNNHGLWLANTRSGGQIKVYNNVVLTPNLTRDSAVTHWAEPSWNETGTVRLWNNTIIGGQRSLNLYKSPYARAWNNIVRPSVGGYGFVIRGANVFCPTHLLEVGVFWPDRRVIQPGGNAVGFQHLAVFRL